MRKYLCISFFLFMYAATCASDNSSQWAKAIELRPWPTIYSVEQTSDGGYVAIGTMNTYGSFGIPPTTVVLSVRLDTFGELQWVKSYRIFHPKPGHPPSLPPAYAYAALQTSDNGFVFAGSERGDALLVKVDSVGKIVWQKSYDSGFSDKASAILPTLDGGFFLVGTSVQSRKSEVWCMKLRSDGSIVWQKAYEDNTNESLNNAVLTGDGGLIFIGTRKDSSAGSLGNDVPWLVKLNRAGKIVWQNTYSVEGLRFAGTTSLTSTSDGGYVVGSSDGWVLKLGPNGAIRWKTAFHQDQDEIKVSVSAVRQEKDGHILVIGNAAGPRADIWSARLDSNGKIVWQEAIGGVRPPTEGSVTAIHDTPDDGTIFIGEWIKKPHGFSDVLIGQTSYNGMVCSPLRKSLEVGTYKISVKVIPTNAATRNNTFAIGGADLQESNPSYKVIDLCR